MLNKDKQSSYVQHKLNDMSFHSFSPRPSNHRPFILIQHKIEKYCPQREARPKSACLEIYKKKGYLGFFFLQKEEEKEYEDAG